MLLASLVTVQAKSVPDERDSGTEESHSVRAKAKEVKDSASTPSSSLVAAKAKIEEGVN